MTNEAARYESAKKNVLICDTQPVAVEGMKWLIENSGDLHFAGSVPTLEAVYELLNPGAAAQAAAELAATEAGITSAALAGLLDPAGPAGFVIEGAEIEVSAAEAIGDDSLPAGLDDGGNESVFEALLELSEEAPELLVTESIVAESIVAEPIVAEPIHAIVIDKGLGLAGVMELLQKLTSTSHPTPAVVWGAAISEAEALRLLQAGARGILRRTSESGTLLTCLRAVTSGGTWMEDGIFGSTEKLFNPRRSQLTHRESEVVVLVEKGLRNRDIARMLGIRTGTVKIHLKHIFEKTGVRGRYGLAFTGLQNKGSFTLAPPPQFTA
jgi:DNA-binding NarL/FixJ family response regulator